MACRASRATPPLPRSTTRPSSARTASTIRFTIIETKVVMIIISNYVLSLHKHIITINKHIILLSPWGSCPQEGSSVRVSVPRFLLGASRHFSEVGRLCLLGVFKASATLHESECSLRSPLRDSRIPFMSCAVSELHALTLLQPA